MSAEGASAAPLFDEDFPALLEHLALLARKRSAALFETERRHRVHGAGLEFADHRAYVPGDDLRRMDWNVAARTGRLMIRRFEEEEDLQVHVAADISASMEAGHPPRRIRALRLAAALAYIGLVRHDRVGLCLFDDRVRVRTLPARGPGRILRLLRVIEGAPSGGHSDLEASLREIVQGTRRKGLILLLTDGFDEAGLVRGLRRARHEGLEVALIRLVDPGDLQIPARGDLRIVDAESGQSLDITMTAALAGRLRDAHLELGRRLEAAARSLSVPYQERSVAEPFVDTVLRTLQGGGILTPAPPRTRRGAWR